MGHLQDRAKQKVDSIKQKFDSIVIENGGVLSTCNRIGMTLANYTAYRNGTVKMKQKTKDRIFREFGVKFD